jgi:amidophosphoribosyltransferase
MRIASPPTQWPCYYGVDTPTRSELIASSHSIAEVNQYITSDTLAYLSLESLTQSVISARRANADKKLTEKSFCHACWSGEYPIDFTPSHKKQQLPLLHV